MLPENLHHYNFIVTFAYIKEVFTKMKKHELERRLKEAGCILSRHGSRHDKWMNPITGAIEFVPRHAGEIANGTAIKILKRLVEE